MLIVRSFAVPGKFVKSAALAALTILIAAPSQGGSTSDGNTVCYSCQTPGAELEDGTSLLQIVSSHRHIEMKPGTRNEKLPTWNAGYPKNSSLLHVSGESGYAGKNSHKSIQGEERTLISEGNEVVTSTYDFRITTGVGYCFLACYVLYSFLVLWYEFWSRREDISNQARSLDAEQPVSTNRSPGWDMVKLFCTLLVIAHHYGIASLHVANWHGAVAEADVYKFQAYLKTTVTAGSALTMCMFSFISGVFGSRLNWSSFAKMFCATIVANILYTSLYWSISALVQRKIDISLETAPNTTWYLAGLFLWRVGITPVFMAADSFGMNRMFVGILLLISFFFLFCTYSGFMLGVKIVPGSMPLLSRKHWFIEGIFYMWGPVYFAQYYTIGCILNVKQWTDILKHRYSLVGAALCFVVWAICLAAFEPVRLWADSMCIYESQCALDSQFWHPDSVIVTSLSQGPSLATAGAYLRAFVQKMFVTLIFLCLTLNVVNFLHPVVPKLINFLAECGSRSLYGWLVTFFIQWQISNNPEYGIYNLMVMKLSRLPPTLITTLLYLLSLHNLFVFTSRLTSRIWEPILQPFWVLNLFDKLFRSDASGKVGNASQS